MSLWSKELVRYIIVGLINTAGGLAIIYLCMALGLGDVTANLIGYAVGFAISFFLNGKWTFRRASLSHVEFAWFVSVVVIAYLVNLGTMLYTRDGLNLGSVVAQMAGVVAYAAVGYFGMKFVAFRVR